MQIIDRIAQIHDDLTSLRRDIHAHPELGFEEQRTSDLVANKLAEFGYEVFRGVGRTGVVGEDLDTKWRWKQAERPGLLAGNDQGRDRD